MVAARVLLREVGGGENEMLSLRLERRRQIAPDRVRDAHRRHARLVREDRHLGQWELVKTTNAVSVFILHVQLARAEAIERPSGEYRCRNQFDRHYGADPILRASRVPR